MNQLKIKDFPLTSFDKIRYADTDRQGHVNNATFRETWRIEVLYNPAILKLANSSLRLYQQIFQHDQCAATAETVIVQVDGETGKGKALSESARAVLSAWVIEQPS